MANTIWQPPILHTKHAEMNEGHERKVTWLELFYDLVYVAIFIQLGNTLSHDISWLGFLEFVALFIPIWWSWTGFVFYVNRFVVEDIWHRILIFTQIFFITIMGISVEGGFGELSIQFALAYVGIRAILILLNLRAGKHIPEAKPLTDRYALGFALAALPWLVSVFVPAPFNYMLWGLGIIIDFGTAVAPSSQRITATLPPHPEHMMERFGLLVIIVMGEAFVKVITGAAGLMLNIPAIIFSIVGLGLTYSLWWHYFDDIAGAKIIPNRAYIWVYAHLPLTISLIGFGVASNKLFLAPPNEPVHIEYAMMMGMMVAIFLIVIAILHLVSQMEEDRAHMTQKTRANLRFAAAGVAVLIALGARGMLPALFVVLMTIISTLPIGIDLAIGFTRIKHPTETGG
jgi:low temperature requirement protein LtrA